MLSMPAASPAWMVRCAPAPVEQGDGRGDAVGREADLGAGEVEADDAGVAVADDEPGHLLPAVGLPHGAQQRADPDRRAGGGGLRAAGREAVDHRLDDRLDGQPLRRRQLRREAHLGVDDAVGGEVERALAGHPVDRLGPLHHADGVREGLQVAHQRAGVGGLPEPAAEALGVGGRQVAVAVLVGELEHRLRPQPAVEVVVQEHLGRAGERLGGQRGRHRRSLPGDLVLPAEGQRRTAPGPTTHQAPSTSATRPSSQVPAGSPAASASGRNTERRPCAIHLSGKTAATVCIQLGQLAEQEEDAGDELQHAARTGVTVAEADRPFFARLETAIPSSVQAAEPRTVTQAKVSQSPPEGRSTS